jgi:hypothetical protein
MLNVEELFLDGYHVVLVVERVRVEEKENLYH